MKISRKNMIILGIIYIFTAIASMFLHGVSNSDIQTFYDLYIKISNYIMFMLGIIHFNIALVMEEKEEE